MALTCLDTLVGLSSTEYACFTDTVPDDFDTSDSGYYLTDVDYGLTVSEQCALAGWTMLSNALTQAIAETKTDLRAKLREKFAGRVSPFSGQIGKLKSTGSLSLSKDYIGIRIRVKRQIRGAKWVFKKIYLGLNTSGAKSVTVTSNDPLFTAPTPVSVTAVANQFANAETSIELPLWSRAEFDAGEYLEYYLTIPRGSVQPLNNTLNCCGSTPGWMGYFWTEGMAADDDEGTGATYGLNANGMVLDGYLTCEELDWLCDAEELGGYYTTDVLARTIQFRGAAIAISALLDTLQVSPCTGYQFENLNAKRNYLNQRYAENVQWIANNIPPGVTDCFTCKPEQMQRRAKLLV